MPSHSAQWVALKATWHYLVPVAHFPGIGIIQSPRGFNMPDEHELHLRVFGSTESQSGGRLQPRASNFGALELHFKHPDPDEL